MIIKTFISGPVNTNSYLIGCPITQQAAVIDTPKGVAASIAQAIQQEQLDVQMIFITHSHWDHIADAASIRKQLDSPLYIHALDHPNLIRPGVDGLPLYCEVEGVKADGFLKEGDKISVGRLALEVIETPGHTPGGVCLWLPEEKILFSGDTLFQGSIGNLSFPTAQPSLMWKSLETLAKLPSETRVYPGHGMPTTIAAEAWIAHAKLRFGGEE